MNRAIGKGFGPFLAVACGLAVTALGGRVAGQDDDRFGGWQKVESAAETRTFKEAMRAGGAFDASSKGYLEQIALPQLAAEGNRPTIAFIRRRIKDILLTEFGSEKAAEDANKTVLAFMEGVAEREDEPPVVRVNAVLMIGELQGQDRKPWAPAAAVLAKMAAAPAVPAAQRIAALVGLARQVDAAKGNSAALGRLATVVVPVIDSILEQPVKPGAVAEANWLVSRALAMLPLFGPASPETAKRVAAALADGSRSIDARVRAAAALAAVAGKESKVDGAAAIRTIEELAVTGLKEDLWIAEKIQLERAFSGGMAGMMSPGSAGGMPGMAPGMPGMAPGGMPGYGAPGMQPAVEQLIPREVCRRAAWRLVALADAVLTADAQKGLVLLPGADSPEAREIAGKLRRGGMDLDASPDDTRIQQALDELRPPPPVSEDEEETGADEAMADKAEAAADEPPADEVRPAGKAPAKPGPKAAQPRQEEPTAADDPPPAANPAATKPGAKPAAGKPAAAKP